MSIVLFFLKIGLGAPADLNKVISCLAAVQALRMCHGTQHEKKFPHFKSMSLRHR